MKIWQKECQEEFQKECQEGMSGLLTCLRRFMTMGKRMTVSIGLNSCISHGFKTCFERKHVGSQCFLAVPSILPPSNPKLMAGQYRIGRCSFLLTPSFLSFVYSKFIPI